MGDLFNPNAFRVNDPANISRSIESGFGMGIRKQDNDRRAEAFQMEKDDRAELRNAMSEYGAATDAEGKEAAMNKVGIVSPQMYSQLATNMRQANSEQRESMKDMIDQRGSMAFTALNEKDPNKRQQLWSQYRESQPEQLRGMIPEEATDMNLNVVMGQSKEMIDFMQDKQKWEHESARDDKRYSHETALEDRRSQNDFALADKNNSAKLSLAERKAELTPAKGANSSATATARLKVAREILADRKAPAAQKAAAQAVVNEAIGYEPDQTPEATPSQNTQYDFNKYYSK